MSQGEKCFITPILYTTRRIFKRFVSRGKKLCSEKYLEEESNFFIEMFVENEHNGLLRPKLCKFYSRRK